MCAAVCVYIFTGKFVDKLELSLLSLSRSLSLLLTSSLTLLPCGSHPLLFFSLFSLSLSRDCYCHPNKKKKNIVTPSDLPPQIYPSIKYKALFFVSHFSSCALMWWNKTDVRWKNVKKARVLHGCSHRVVLIFIKR